MVAALALGLALVDPSLGSAGHKVTAGGHGRPARHRHATAAYGACLNAGKPGLRDIDPSIARVPNGAPGKVLPGTRLRSQTPRRKPFTFADPRLAHYPGGKLPSGPLTWRDLDGVAPSRLVYAKDADAVFNAENARYRVAFTGGYFGVAPTDIGDFNGDGVDDLAIPDHFAYVDGRYQAGQLDIYYGRRGQQIDPRKDIPDVIFYGDEARSHRFGDGSKFGIAVAPAGDVNGDGHDDLLVAAAFHSVRGPHGREIPLAGKVYLIYGGTLGGYRCPVKIRSTDIGTKVPGVVFEGGHDGGLYTGWANELDAGDLNGDGLNDIIIGSYDPYSGTHPTFGARAYLIYGSRHLSRRYVGYRLGVNTDRAGIRSTVYSLPDGEATRQSLGFSATFTGDLKGDGHDDLAFSAAQAGANGRGEDYIFFGAPPRGQKRVDIQSAPLTIYADDMASPSLQFAGLGSIRPNGEIYGDGHQDALLTARYTRGIDGSLVGAVGVLRGRPSYPARMGFSQLDTIIYGTQVGTVGQPSMAHAADFDGDGCTDIVINDATYMEDIGGEQQFRGRLWLLRGRTDLPHTLALEPSADRIFLSNNRYPGMYGFNWDAGDWNKDGRPDLIIADHYSGDNRLDDFAGRTYLFYNHSLHLPWGPKRDCAARR